MFAVPAVKQTPLSVLCRLREITYNILLTVCEATGSDVTGEVDRFIFQSPRAGQGGERLRQLRGE